MVRGFLTFLTLLLFQVPAVALQPFAATKEELTLLPSYCSLPDKSLAKACFPLNHYCDGLKAMIRGSKFNAESGYWLQLAVKSFRTAANRKSWSGCPLRPEANLNLGKALLFQSRQKGASTAEGVVYLKKALELKPDYLAAYYTLSNYYAESGDKKKALSVVEDGLRHVPNSKGLLRRFKELGGTTPPAPVIINSKPEIGAAEKDASAEGKNTAIESATAR